MILKVHSLRTDFQKQSIWYISGGGRRREVAEMETNLSLGGTLGHILCSRVGLTLRQGNQLPLHLSNQVLKKKVYGIVFVAEVEVKRRVGEGYLSMRHISLSRGTNDTWCYKYIMRISLIWGSKEKGRSLYSLSVLNYPEGEAPGNITSVATMWAVLSCSFLSDSLRLHG